MTDRKAKLTPEQDAKVSEAARRALKNHGLDPDHAEALADLFKAAFVPREDAEVARS